MKVNLPIDEYLPEIIDRLKLKSGLVLTAEPGAGKTTRLPPAILSAVSGKILVLEPRRMAAAAAAARIAEEEGWRLGDEVGYQVRFENRTTDNTRLIFLTEALLNRRLLSDPELKGVSAVVLDEFHERSLHVDLALGMLRELQLLGHPVKIVVMSATMNPAPITEFLGGVPSIQVPGKLFPLTTEYQSSSLRLRLDGEFYKSLVQTIRRAVQNSKEDVLVFLPGVGEIRRTQQELESLGLAQTVVLHGSLSLSEQQQILRRSSQRRIILSTNIAESSLTLDGVTSVVDSGLARVMRHDPRSGFSRLEICRISKANADQRAGRAARQAAGFCYRMWSKAEMPSFLPQETPEILRADLTESLLFLSSQGIRSFENFNWFQAPLSSQITRARRELEVLNALEADGTITELGKKLLRWPIAPRHAKLMEEAIARNCRSLGADICAILSERDFLNSRESLNHLADQWECDLSLRLHLLDEFRRGSRNLNLETATVKSVMRQADQLRDRRSDDSESDLSQVKSLLLHAFGDRIVRRRNGTDRGVMRGGRGVKLAPESLVKQSPFFIALQGVDLEGNADSLIPLASGLEKSDILKEFADQIREHYVCHFDRDSKKFIEVRERRLGDLVIEQSQPQSASPEKVRDFLGAILLEQLEWLKEQNSQLKRWFQRWNYFCVNFPEIPALSDETVKSALQAAAGQMVDLEKIAQLDLAAALESSLDFETREEFARAVPSRIQVPSGSWIDVEYPEGQSPYLAVRLQELFGLASSPSVLHGRVPLVLHLLAPNFRPVQQTADLRSFWSGGYFEVRKELRARYPKHSWPDDPLKALPQAKGRRRPPP